MAFPQQPLAILVELLLGGVWTPITGYVYGRDDIVIKRGRSREGATVDTSSCELSLNNESGDLSWRNPAALMYGLIGLNTNIRVSVLADSGTRYYRFAGEIPEWPTKWISNGLDVWAPIQAFGLLRRLDGGSPPARDAMRRFTDAHTPLSYWPFTDGSDSREAAELVSGGRPIRALGRSGSLFQDQPAWGEGSVAPWLDGVAQLTQRDSGGTLTGAVALQDVTDWAFDHVRAGRGRDESLYLAGSGDGTTASPSVRWQINYDGDADNIKIYSAVLTDSGETGTLEDTISSPGIYDADPHHLRFTVADDGAGGTDWELFVDGLSAASGNLTDATGALTGITYVWAQEDTAGVAEEVSIGHLTYWDTASAPTAAQGYVALLGHQRELAGRRIERLCQEEGVQLAVHGDLDDTLPMGPQYPGALMALLRESEKVDGGTLGESRSEVALEYRTCRSRYNQGVSA